MSRPDVRGLAKRERERKLLRELCKKHGIAERTHTMEGKTMKKVTYITIDYADLEDLIKKHFDVPEYEILCDLEAYNDSHKVMHIEARGFNEDDQYSMKQFTNWITSKGRDESYMTYLAMCKLAKDGKIEEGPYLIKVSW